MNTKKKKSKTGQASAYDQVLKYFMYQDDQDYEKPNLDAHSETSSEPGQRRVEFECSGVSREWKSAVDILEAIGGAAAPGKVLLQLSDEISDEYVCIIGQTDESVGPVWALRAFISLGEYCDDEHDADATCLLIEDADEIRSEIKKIREDEAAVIINQFGKRLAEVVDGEHAMAVLALEKLFQNIHTKDIATIWNAHIIQVDLDSNTSMLDQKSKTTKPKAPGRL